MANKDYDELMQAFMNNSQKVYNEDKEAQNKNAKKLPTSYSTFDNKGTKNVKKKSSDKKNGNKKGGSGEKKVGNTILKIIAVVGIICSSVLFVYGYSIVHGDVVFNLDDEASSQNQTSFIYGYDDNNEPVEITRLHGEENRIWLDIDDMTPYLS